MAVSSHRVGPAGRGLPKASDVLLAATRLNGHVATTPVLESPVLNELAGGRVFLKAECLQITGSFKVRGAFNRLLQLSRGERRRGVVGWSAGNHGQALAHAGKRLGAPVTIVMPADAPMAKVEGTRRWGAQVIFYRRGCEDREQIGRTIAVAQGSVIVPPYEDADVIAGQGTACLELLAWLRSRNITINEVVVPVGGGGLIAGSVLAAAVLGSDCHFVSAEPAGHDDTRQSIEAGARVTINPPLASIADALMTPTPGALAFEIYRRRVAEGLSVSDEHLANAVQFGFRHLHLVLEPGGAAGLAAVLNHPGRFAGQNTAVILSGGNVDATSFASFIGAAPTCTS